MSKLYFWRGVMNSGKSAHAIMQIHSLKEKGYKVMVFKPDNDIRQDNAIRSRAIRDEVRALNFSQLDEMIKLWGSEIDYIFIDEAQFLSAKEIDKLSAIVDELGIPVFAYGLSLDFRGELFEGSKRLIENADTVRELSSPCQCGRKATHHLRRVDDKYVFHGETILTGDIEMYDSVCRKCFNKAKNGGNK